MKTKYQFQVPDQKRIRMIVHTDCKNEADDQYALVHHLLTPKFIVRGIIAAHFEKSQKPHEPGTTASLSLEEINHILKLMDAEEFPAYLGAQLPMKDEYTPQDSEGARFIVEEAMRDDPHPLYIACQGSLTDVASALLMEPKIADRMTVVWIGGGTYPNGGFEFNLFQDAAAANVLMKSKVDIWQIPCNVYRTMSVTLAELQWKVSGCSEIGKYLFEQLLEVNMDAANIPDWPNGESWGLGDSPTIGVFLEDMQNRDFFDEVDSPIINYEDYTYDFSVKNRKIRVYKQINPRLILDDFFAKININFGE